jgi:hypothetical protein
MTETDSLNRALALCGVTIDSERATARLEMLEYTLNHTTIKALMPVVVYACDAGVAWRVALVCQPGPRAAIWNRVVCKPNDDVVRIDITVPKGASHAGKITAYTARSYIKKDVFGVSGGGWNDPEMDITGPRWLHVYGPGGPGVIHPKGGM